MQSKYLNIEFKSFISVSSGGNFAEPIDDEILL